MTQITTDTSESSEGSMGRFSTRTLGTLGKDIRQCLELCQDCFGACTELMAYCLSKKGDHADPTHIRLLLDCADICETSASFLLRNSDNHGRTCSVCAEICSACAEDCENFDDEMMKKGAEICRQCADACRKMAA